MIIFLNFHKFINEINPFIFPEVNEQARQKIPEIGLLTLSSKQKPVDGNNFL